MYDIFLYYIFFERLIHITKQSRTSPLYNYLILAQHRRSVVCYYLCISTGKVAQHFTFINLFISLILHIYISAIIYMIVCLSSSRSTRASIYCNNVTCVASEH